MKAKAGSVECIVAGAGPAGALAALNLARAGVDVLCLEKEAMPRFKACGGGLTMRGAKILDGMDFERFSLFTSRSVVFGDRPGNFHRVASDFPLSHMVRREEFDSWLAREAAKAGAVLKENEPLIDAGYDGVYFTVTTGAGAYRCRYLIGAEGVYSPTRRIFYPEMPKRRAFAVECQVPSRQLEKLKIEEQLFVFGDGWPGYAWIFPRGEESSAGVYAAQSLGSETLARLKGFLKTAGFPDTDRITYKGHPIPFDGIHYRQKAIPCMLAGDAGGFADFATGEGLSYALMSGKVAAEAVLDSKRRGRFDAARTNRAYRRSIIGGLVLGEMLGRAVFYRKDHFFGLLAGRHFAGMMLEAAVNGYDYLKMIRNMPWCFLKNLFAEEGIRRIQDPFAA